MTVLPNFTAEYTKLPERLFARVAPVPVPDPGLIAFNTQLAEALGFGEPPAPNCLSALFSGNDLPDTMQPVAQIYAGHQFGNWNPQLGDGRAHLLGELRGRDGLIYDVQLKGSGPTPFSRGGDGRAWLGPVLREYLISEAMHAIGIPTTRALAAVRTGAPVLRDDGPLPGAILTRVARSHVRVGHFQLLAARGWNEELKALFHFTCDRLGLSDHNPETLLDHVINGQIDLITRWMGLGFIHGVMNTDNCALSCETIDYGPCAFMEGYNPGQVFSAIDRFGRYAYDQQPWILCWNMAQFASALIPLMPNEDAAVDDFTARVRAMPDRLSVAQSAHFAAKLGLQSDSALVAEFLQMMTDLNADFTLSFLHLSGDAPQAVIRQHPDFANWSKRWRADIADMDAAVIRMRQMNPQIIPRNHIIQQVIDAGLNGDDAPFHAALQALTQPFDRATDAFAAYRNPAQPDELVTRTFCGT